MQEVTEVKTQQVTTKSTRTMDCFRKIKDKETGEVSVKRWQDERQVTANLQTAGGSVFHNGARIA